uniref:Uncharacterized protein n=1 Tax=Arundo donax TaxID=35708 RepID=A0A0A9CZK5_ARUDO
MAGATQVGCIPASAEDPGGRIGGGGAFDYRSPARSAQRSGGPSSSLGGDEDEGGRAPTAALPREATDDPAGGSRVPAAALPVGRVAAAAGGLDGGILTTRRRWDSSKAERRWREGQILATVMTNLGSTA